MKSFFLKSMIVLIGIFAGGGLGAYLTFTKYAQQYAVVRAFAWLQLSLAASENEFDSNSINAKNALLNTLYFYERGVQSPKLDSNLKNALRMNRGRLETQLSVLEKEAGNADQAKLDMSEAQKEMKAVGWIDTSEENILQTFERQAITPCVDSAQSPTKPSTSLNDKPCG